MSVPPAPLARHLPHIAETDRTRLTAMLEVVPSAAVVFSVEGTAVAANRLAAAELVIDPVAPLDSQSWPVVLQPLGVLAADVVGAVRAAAPGVVHTVTGRNEGRSFEVRATRIDEGLLLISVADHTAREAARSELAMTQRQFLALLEVVPAAVYIVSTDGRIVRTNAAARQRHDSGPRSGHEASASLAPEAAVSGVPDTARTWWLRDQPRVPEEAPAPVRSPMLFVETPVMRALGGRAVSAQRVLVRRQGAYRLLEVHATPLYDDGIIAGAVVVELDVCDEGAGSAQHLDAIRQLARRLIHDLNNGLNPIMTAAYLARHHADAPDQVRGYADQITTAAEQTAAMLAQLAGFVRQEPVALDAPVVDLSALVDAAIDAAIDATGSASANSSISETTAGLRVDRSPTPTIVREVQPGLGVRGVAGELMAALVQVIRNALEAMQEAMQEGMPNSGALTVRAARVGEEVQVEVRDTGTGMRAEVQARAFEPFFTTRSSPHTGLGLADVYGAVRRHRGTIQISSLEGEGTTVRIALPMVLPVPLAVGTAHATSATTRRILVVEDHDDSRELIRRVLVAEGYTVEVASSLGDAMQQLDVPTIPFDLVLTDVGLPDGSGWDLVKFLRRVAPSLRLAVITGWDAGADDDAAGVEFILRKPLRAPELKAHIAGLPSSFPTGG